MTNISRLVFPLSCTVMMLMVGPVIHAAESEPMADEAARSAAFQSAYFAYQEYANNQDYVRAVPEAKTAYELGLEIYGPEHKNTTALAYNYGISLLEIGAKDEARKILKETLKLYEGAYGKKSTELIPILMDLGHASAEAFRPGKQIKYYNRALKLANKEYGQDSERYGRLLIDAGKKILNEAQSPAAQKYLQNGYRILNAKLGPDDSTTGYAAFQLARYEYAQRRYEKAERYLLAALKTFEDPERPSSAMEMSTHAWLVTVYEELGESRKATEHCQAIGRMTPINGNQEYLPLFRKQPKYPMSAAQRGIEGYIDVSFTVDPEGIVREIRVTEGDETFVSASLEAVEQWRYAPKFIDGQPVATPNVKTRLTYKFADRR